MLLFVGLKMYYDIISRTKGRSVSWWTRFHRLNTDVESEKFAVNSLYMVMKMLLCLYSGGSVFFICFLNCTKHTCPKVATAHI